MNLLLGLLFIIGMFGFPIVLAFGAIFRTMAEDNNEPKPGNGLLWVGIIIALITAVISTHIF